MCELTFLRYPGGKRRLLPFLVDYLPSASAITGRYIEPFIGGGSVFFYLQPRRALLADINIELIDLYRGIRYKPEKVWELFRDLPSGKQGYNRIRKLKHAGLNLINRAARSLFLNRTCFKGMWRHNAKGEFNIGYGGQTRRWAISKDHLITVSKFLRRATIRCSDFESIIKESKKGDYVFIDPPYKPGNREQLHAHYVGRQFSYKDHQRLACCLKSANKKGVKWAMTTSNHSDIIKLFSRFQKIAIPKGTGSKIGTLSINSGEILICNYNGGTK